MEQEQVDPYAGIAVLRRRGEARTLRLGLVGNVRYAVAVLGPEWVSLDSLSDLPLGAYWQDIRAMIALDLLPAVALVFFDVLAKKERTPEALVKLARAAEVDLSLLTKGDVPNGIYLYKPAETLTEKTVRALRSLQALGQDAEHTARLAEEQRRRQQLSDRGWLCRAATSQEALTDKPDEWGRATGADLDAISKDYGFRRGLAESDSAFRERIQAYMVGP